jgi:hypothetical protein
MTASTLESPGTVLAHKINTLLIRSTKTCLLSLGIFNEIADLIDRECPVMVRGTAPKPGINGTGPEGPITANPDPLAASTVAGMVHRTPTELLALKEALNRFFGRRTTTPWSDKEESALKRVFPYHLDDFMALHDYYTADHPKDADYRRRDLYTLLGNWTGEVDRAKRWQAEQAPKVEKPKDFTKF